MRKMKRKVSLLFALLMLLVFVFDVSTVQAAAEPKLSKKSVEYELSKMPITDSIKIEGVKNTSQISSLQSSAKKVVDVEVGKSGNDVYLYITPKKTGKTNISFDVKYGKKTKTLKLAVKVKKYQCVMKSLKIGGKSYTSQLKKDFCYFTKIKGLKSKKITVTAKSGWKLDSIQVQSASGTKKIKNGKKVGASAAAIYITMKNKKTKEVKTYEFLVNFG